MAFPRTGIRSLRWFQGCFISPTKWFRADPALRAPFAKNPVCAGSNGRVEKREETLAVSPPPQAHIT
jgi:hypothetical protein